MKDISMRVNELLDKYYRNQKKELKITISLTIIGLVVFLFLAFNFPLRNTLLSLLFPKPPSFAAPTLGNGDTNGDALVNDMDVKATIENILATPSALLDQYGDGKLNSFDFAHVINRQLSASATPTPSPVSSPAPSPSPSPTASANLVVINHNNVNAATIPQYILDSARNLDVVFNHQSVGYNILLGLTSLATQNVTRYSLTQSANPAASWFVANSGVGEFTRGGNNYPDEKISEFNTLIRSGYAMNIKVALMKFCYVDFLGAGSNFTGQQIWDLYRPMIEGLKRDFPNVTFVWTTAAMANNDGGAKERSAFNNLVRQYVQTNGGTLFDLADIETTDPSGNPVVDSNNYSVMYSGYTSDGGHLNSTGQQRVASAWWNLMARITGWIP